MPAIFISHSSRDQTVADDLKSALAGMGFGRVFLDFDKDSGIGAGEAWERRLYEEVSRCHAVILVLTPNWLASTWCRVELAQARALGKVIVPVVCAPLGERYVLPEIQAVDLVDWNADGLERIAQRLHAITDELARGFTLASHRAPYPGIHAFEAEDAAIFFGRDDDVRGVIERLDARRTKGGARLVLVIGASGAGKSSVLKAGVLPQLGRRRREWIVFPTIRPEKAPLEALAKTFAEMQGKPQGWRAWYERLQGPQATREITEMAKDLRVGPARAATVLLPIDQLEELFTIAEANERATFLAVMTALLGPARDLPLIAVATGRADVLHGLLETSGLAPLTEPVPLLPMPLDRMPRLVEGPATVASLIVERGLAERIARDVETPEALPLLAQTLRLLHDRYAHDKRLTLAAYELLGDAGRGLNPVQNSVRLAADQAIGALKPSNAEFAALRDAFVPHLVRLRLNDGRRVRQPAPRASFPREAERLVQALTDARLLTVRADDGEAVVEVAHEALFAAWPILAAWLDEEQRFLIDLERIKNVHEAWAEVPQKDKSQTLLQGLLLANARDWLIKYPQRFTGREMEALRAFIAASAAAEDAGHARAQRLRQRAFQAALIAVVVFFAAAVVSSWQYFRVEGARRVAAESEKVALEKEEAARLAQQESDRQRDAARITQSRLLVARARQLTTASDPVSAILLSLEALPDPNGKVQPYVPEAELSLFEALSDLRERAGLVGHTGAVTKVSFSPDGRQILSASYDGTARLWDAATGQQIAVLHSGTRPVNDAIFVNAGERIVTLPDNQWLPSDRQDRHPPPEVGRLWDRATGLPIATLGDDGLNVTDLAVSPDGQNILADFSDGSIRVLSAATGQTTALLQGHIQEGAHPFSPDGSKVITLSRDGGPPKVWDTTTGTELASLPAGPGEIRGAAYSPDGLLILTWATESVTAWHANAWNRLFSVQLTKHKDYSSIADPTVSPDGRYLITGHEGSIALWDTVSGKRISGYDGTYRYPVSLEQISVSPDSRSALSIYAVGGDYTGNDPQLWQLGNNPQPVYLHHDDWVTFAKYSADGHWIITGTSDNVARLWDARSGGLIATLQDFTGREYERGDAAFSPDGERLVTASSDHSLRLWNVESGTLQTNFGPCGTDLNQKDEIDASNSAGPLFSTNAKLSAVVAGKKVIVADIDSARRVILDPHVNGLIRSTAFSPDGRLIALAIDGDGRGYKTQISLFEASTGRPVITFYGMAKAEINFPENGNLLATVADQGRTVKIWDPAVNKATLSLVDTEQPVEFEWSNDGTRLVTMRGLFDAATGRELAEFKGQRTEDFGGIGVHLSIEDGVVEIDAVLDNGPAAQAGLKPGDVITDVNGLSLQGISLEAVVTKLQGPIGSQARLTIQSRQDQPHEVTLTRETILHVIERQVLPSFSRDSRRLAAPSGRIVDVISAETGAKLFQLSGHSAPVTAALYSPDGSFIATAGDDATVRLWDAENGRKLRVLSTYDDTAGISVSADGGMLVMRGTHHGARLWETATGRVIGELEPNEVVETAEFQANGRWLTTTVRHGDKTEESVNFKVWDASNGQQILGLKGGSYWAENNFPAFTEHMMLINDLDVGREKEGGGVNLYKLPSGQLLTSFPQKRGIYRSGFSADGKRVLTIGMDVMAGVNPREFDNSVRLWDIATTKVVAIVPRDNDENRQATDANRLTTLVCGRAPHGLSEQWSLWRLFLTTTDILDYAEEVVPRCFSANDRAQFSLDPEPPVWCITKKSGHTTHRHGSTG